MVIDNDGEGDRDIHRTWEKITEMTSNGFCNGQSSNSLFRFRFRCREIGWVSCFGLDRWRPRFDGVMKCERKRREGSEKEGKFWLKYFEGSEKWSSPKFAMVISHDSPWYWYTVHCRLKLFHTTNTRGWSPFVSTCARPTKYHICLHSPFLFYLFIYFINPKIEFGYFFDKQIECGYWVKRLTPSSLCFT